MFKQSPDHTAALITEFETFVQASDFPCVGAKSALAKRQMHFVVANDICSAWDDIRIWQHLCRFAGTYREKDVMFQTFVVIFAAQRQMSEVEFERALWDRVQSLSDKDEWLGGQPDPRVSARPEDPDFSLSFGGEAFFVVGMHPGASRPARRFSHPVLVFNAHDQFARLRGEGRYEKLRETILHRDEQLAGSRNPMLARHGDRSEARQYSGRAVGPDWQCPFNPRGSNNAHDQ
jgi:uncharacterized protein